MDNAITYVTSLANSLRNELGFLPHCQYTLAMAEHRLELQRVNESLCGYLLAAMGRPGRHLKIYQVAIQVDARHAAAASDLVRRIESRARRRGCTGVSLRCAADLDANRFWRAIGYEPTALEPGGDARGRQLIRYVKRFDTLVLRG